jgi:hypothetical protein
VAVRTSASATPACFTAAITRAMRELTSAIASSAVPARASTPMVVRATSGLP